MAKTSSGRLRAAMPIERSSFPIERLAAIFRFHHRQLTQLDPFKSGEARGAALALTTAADRGAIIRRTAVLHLARIMAAEGTAHRSVQSIDLAAALRGRRSLPPALCRKAQRGKTQKGGRGGALQNATASLPV